MPTPELDHAELAMVIAALKEKLDREWRYDSDWQGGSSSSIRRSRWPHFPARPPPLPLQVMLAEPTHQTGNPREMLSKAPGRPAS
jgi:hypothetical protein